MAVFGKERVRSVVAAAAVAVAAATVHGGAVGASFVKFDDDLYVYANRRVMSGLGADGVAWAFGDARHESYYHPVTWLSLMLDRNVFGPEPWGFHLTNVLLHVGNAVLVLLVLRLATGRLAAPLGAALLFAVHPLGVEAVSWVTERKTVLATFLGLAAVLAYLAHARRPSAPRLVAVTALLAASLLAKPVFIAMPLLLLALDAWPLARLRREEGTGTGPFPRVTFRAAILEKLPLVLACTASAAVSLLTTQEPAGDPPPPDAATVTGLDLPVALRAANAVASIPRYVAAAAWPTGLAPLHPFPGHVSPAAVAAGAALVIATTAAVVAARRRAPWLLSGWAWFLVALAPMLGAVQSGLWPAWAERFAYMPLVGLAFAASFSAAALAERHRAVRAAVSVLAAVAVVALSLAARAQVAWWRDSETLFRRAVQVEPLAAEMHTKLAEVLMDAGRLDEAERVLERSVMLAPWQTAAQSRLGSLLHRRGLVREAEARFRAALRWDPNSVDALYGLADLLRRTGRDDEARPFYARYAAARADRGR